MGKKKRHVIKENDSHTSSEKHFSLASIPWLNRILSSRPLQLVLLLTVAGLFLRLYQLGFNSIWLDEASTLGYIQRPIGEIWAATAGGGGDFNPPLFYWMEHMMLIFGESEFVLRLLPALFGALTIPLFYLVGRELIDEQTGLIAAALLVVSPFHIFYSQEARAFVPMLFFFALACWLFLIARRQNRPIDWILFAVASALSVWTHFYVLIPLAVLFFFEIVMSWRSILNKERPFLPFGLGIGVFGLLFLPLFIVGLGLFSKHAGAGHVWSPSGLQLLFVSIESLSGYNAIIAMFLMILFVFGVIGLLLTQRNEGILISLLFLSPLIASLLFAEIIPMQPRYLIIMLLPYFIGIAAIFRYVPESIKSPQIITAIVLILCLIHVPFLSGYYTTYSKNDWRGFSSELSRFTEEGDVIVAVPGYMRQPLNYYYSNVTDGTIQLGATTSENLDDIVSRYPENRIFFVATWDMIAADPTGGANRWLEENTEYAGSMTGIHLFVRME